MFLPEKVKQIISILEQNGFEAYAVGGCVRDTLLGRTPEDWDITTDASPEKIKALFRRTVDTGIAHGTVTVLLDRDSFEVTTYRIDGIYEDARHPKEVTFTGSLREDLRRRDFTINAMAYNEKNGLVDCFGGMEDLKAGVIRCVGDPAERFSEDALRILRCVRFSAQLGFSVERKTEEAAIRMADNLQKISAERIAVEWTKLLLSPHVDRIMTAYRYGILKQFFPEITVTERLVRAVSLIPVKSPEKEADPPQDGFGKYSSGEQKWLRYAMLFCGLCAGETKTDGESSGKAVGDRAGDEDAGRRPVLAEALLRRLKFDNETIRTVTGLVRYTRLWVPAESSQVRRAVHAVGEELFPLLFPVWRAYALADYGDGQSLDHIQRVESLYRRILADGDCLSLKKLAVNGGDLIAMGISPGRALGARLDKLLELVLEDPSRNTGEYLRNAAKEMEG